MGTVPIVIYAENDNLTRLLTAEVLRRYGMEVYPAADGEEALSLMEDITPTLLLTDLRMPGLSGDELIIKLRALGWDMPIAVFSGHPLPDKIADLVQLYVEKAEGVAALAQALIDLIEHGG